MGDLTSREYRNGSLRRPAGQRHLAANVRLQVKYFCDGHLSLMASSLTVGSTTVFGDSASVASLFARVHGRKFELTSSREGLYAQNSVAPQKLKQFHPEDLLFG